MRSRRNPVNRPGHRVVRAHRMTLGGTAAALFQGEFETPDGAESWVVKVPLRNKAGAKALGLREFLGSRIAFYFGLPVLACQPAHLVPTPRDHDLAPVGPPHAASPFCSGLQEIEDWGVLPHRIAAQLVASTFALPAFDRIRAKRPRDVFRDSAGRLVVLDHEGFSQAALDGGPPEGGSPNHDAVLARVLEGIDRGQLTEGAESLRALGEDKHFFEELATEATGFAPSSKDERPFDPSTLQAWASAGAMSLEATLRLVFG